MRLHDGGREYAHFAWWGATPTDPPPEVANGTTGWVTAAWWDNGTGPVWDDVLADLGVKQADIDDGRARIFRVPVRTPTAPTSDAPALQLPKGRATGLARLVIGDEVVIRDWTDSILVT